jgi:hypothetical protein
LNKLFFIHASFHWRLNIEAVLTSSVEIAI